MSHQGIPASRFEAVVDGLALPDDSPDRELLLRIALRLPAIPDANLRHWSQRKTELTELVQSPEKYRGDLFDIEGRVVHIERVAMSEAERDRIGYRDLFRCRLFAGTPEVPTVVYVRSLPKSFAIDQPIDQRVSFRGILFGRGPGSVGVAPLVFVASRLAWYPDSLLGDLGMDMGLMDRVVHNKPLRSEENQAFYSMLVAVDTATTGELPRRARNDLVHQLQKWMREEKQLDKTARQPAGSSQTTHDANGQASPKEPLDLAAKRAQLKSWIDNAKENLAHPFIPLLEDPRPYMGQLRWIRGTAHRILRVRVDPDLAQRFGFTHYYQIDMMVQLEQRIRLIQPHASGEAPKHRNTSEHPVTVCVRYLPEGMPLGDKVHEQIRVAGFLFKSWAFPTGEYVGDEVLWRSAPMFIAKKPVWAQPEESQSGEYMGWIAGGLFILVLTGIWLGLWRTSRGDRKFHRVVMAKAYDPDPGVSLNDLGIEADGMPDFSHLDGDTASEPEPTPPSTTE